MNTIATLTSIALQYGVPFYVLVNKFSHTRFEPSGWTGNPDVPYASSLVDYVFRYLGARYGNASAGVGGNGARNGAENENLGNVHGGCQGVTIGDSTICPECGGLMERAGKCHVCSVCGSTNGCS